MDSTIRNIPFTNCYLDDILVASEGSFTEHKNIVHKVLPKLDNKISQSIGQNVSSFKKNTVAWP